MLIRLDDETAAANTGRRMQAGQPELETRLGRNGKREQGCRQLSKLNVAMQHPSTVYIPFCSSHSISAKLS